MTTPNSHAGPLPPHRANDFRWREQFTQAWLHAICAPNLAQAVTMPVDDGIDASIKYKRQHGLVTLETQLKSVTPTQRGRLQSGNVIQYRVSRSRAEALTETAGFPVGLFVVIEVPPEQENWCVRSPALDDQHLKVATRSWWTLVVRSGLDVPAALAAGTTRLNTGTSGTVRLDMHDESHLDVFTLNELLNGVSEWLSTRGVAA